MTNTMLIIGGLAVVGLRILRTVIHHAEHMSDERQRREHIEFLTTPQVAPVRRDRPVLDD